jgi:hypothetical protein
LPGQTLPGFVLGGHRYPSQRIAPVDIPSQVIPGQSIPGGCLDVPAAFTPSHTTVRVSGYPKIDPSFSAPLSQQYWNAAGSGSEIPNPTAPGFGELNAAGFPKDQYVRSYVRRDGTMVSGYWRNSPNDGLPTCRVISC